MRGRLQRWTAGDGPQAAAGARRITDWVDERAATRPDAVAFVHLVDGEAREDRMTYGEVAARARGFAVGLLERDLVGRRVAILLPPGLDYVVALLGCFYAGAVAVPILPAMRGSAFERLTTILTACDATLAVLPSEAARGYGGSLPGTRTQPVSVPDIERASERALPTVDASSVAFLQYTSGSTAAPRGAVVRHDNVVANVRTMVFDGQGPCVSWLPPHHDMGLIGALLLTFMRGESTVMLSPLHFVQRPVRWLRAMTRFRGLGCPAPDFGYRLCVDKVSDADLEGLDLSTWRFALSGAEPVLPSTLDAFCERFGPVGFRREAFVPCYGLAEATLMVSCARAGSGPRTLVVDAASLERRRVHEAGEGPSKTLVCSGRIVAETEVAIVAEAPDDDVGEIWVRGPGVVGGYFRDRARTAEVFDAVHPEHGAGFLRTGDLGFLADDELYVTGRVKDTIVVRGRNLLPQDIETAARRAAPSLGNCRVAAFSDEAQGEGVVVCMEVPGRTEVAELRTLSRAIADRVAADERVRPRRVVFVGRKSIPHTTSGKVRRAECRLRLDAGEMDVLAQWVAAQ